MRRNPVNKPKNEKIEEQTIDKKYLKVSKKSKIIFACLIVALIFVYYQVYMLYKYTIGEVDKSKMWLYNGVNYIVALFVDKADNSLKEEEYTLKLAALGDIYCTSNTISGAKTSDGYDFKSDFENVKKELANYDVVLASLNTPIAGSKLKYSASTVYNSPEEILDAIKELGITTVATANSHIYDKGSDGISNTIETLKLKQINQVGINNSEEESKPVVIEKNSIKLGVLSYATDSSVKIKAADSELVNILDEAKVKKDVEYLKTQNVDFIISYVSIPNVESTMISSDQKKNVDILFNNGVNVVFGTGSKVVQGEVDDTIKVDDSNKYNVYAIYSLGDFIGEMDTVEKSVNIIGNIAFSKNVYKDKSGNVVEEKTKTDFTTESPIPLYNTVNTKNKHVAYTVNDAINSDSIKLGAKEYTSLQEVNKRLENLFKTTAQSVAE